MGHSQGLIDATMPSNFVIYTYPRTGSNNLVSLLHSADDITCHGEIFTADRLNLHVWFQERLNKTLEDRIANPLGYLSDLRAISKYQNFGFKLFNEHLHQTPALRQLLHFSDWKKVILLRDPVEMYSSVLRAIQTNVWWVTNETERVAKKILNQKVRFSVETWDAHVRDVSYWIRVCETIQDNVFVAVYGEYDKPRPLAKLLEFIGSNVNAKNLVSQTKKQFTARLQDGFENWDEFQEYLKVVPSPTLLRQTT
jgi:hypothetical protein